MGRRRTRVRGGKTRTVGVLMGKGARATIKEAGSLRVVALRCRDSAGNRAVTAGASRSSRRDRADLYAARRPSTNACVCSVSTNPSKVWLRVKSGPEVVGAALRGVVGRGVDRAEPAGERRAVERRLERG